MQRERNGVINGNLTQKALMTQYNRYKVVACLLLKTKANNSSTKPQKPYCITINLWN
jgi:hypothetical protein